MRPQTTTEAGIPLKPFLTNYEAVIPELTNAESPEYDEARMILVINGEPAALSVKDCIQRATKVTFVAQETTDDE